MFSTVPLNKMNFSVNLILTLGLKETVTSRTCLRATHRQMSPGFSKWGGSQATTQNPHGKNKAKALFISFLFVLKKWNYLHYEI